jgi:hypothetical protein
MYVLCYASMLQCWHLVWILVRIDHPCLGVGCHRDTRWELEPRERTSRLIDSPSRATADPVADVAGAGEDGECSSCSAGVWTRQPWSDSVGCLQSQQAYVTVFWAGNLSNHFCLLIVTFFSSIEPVSLVIFGETRHTMRWQQWANSHSYPRVSWQFKSIYTLRGKNLTNTSYAWPLKSHVWQSSSKSLLSQNRASTPGMKSCLSTIVRPGRHPGLPHSPSTKPSRCREGRFKKVVTKLLGLPSPIKPDMRFVQIKAYPSRSNQCGP